MLLATVTKEEQSIVEQYVRKTLGQDLTKVLLDGERSEHLRFNMSGNRDSDIGEIHNEQIWNLFTEEFQYNLTIKRSYGDPDPLHADTKYVFIFHKGNGELYYVGINNLIDEEPIETYGGYGTVEILTDLILRFSIGISIKRMSALL